jgi:hypothetical protein
VLEDRNNHVIDALRYACEGARRAQTKEVVYDIGASQGDAFNHWMAA